MNPLLVVAAGAVGGRAAYRRLVAGDLTIDLRSGRTTRPLGPIEIRIDAPRELVFDVVAAPYLGRTPRALAKEIDVLERGSDMVLAAHRTVVGRGLVATTLETVRFEPPAAVHFRLVRGPVPHVVETFRLVDDDAATVLRYDGELGADGWAIGRWWGEQVGRRWEAAVAASFEQIRSAAEQRAARRRSGGSPS
jgi:hypothetical protein